LDSYLAEELIVETNHRVLRHMDECHECAMELQRRQQLRRLLSQSFDIDVDAQRATARISHALGREQRSWKRVASFVSAAAMLVTLMALTYWAGRPTDVSAYDDSAEDHVACALIYPADFTYDANRTARNLAAPFRPIAEAVGLWHGGYQVIDAHMCPYKGRNYAHLVFRGDGQMLSLFAERAERGALPATETTALVGERIDIHATSRLGYRVSALSTRDYQLFLVSERPTDPPDVEHEILRSAVRFVRGLEQ
jgi:hypothetical protein